jgi:hypothetical protein
MAFECDCECECDEPAKGHQRECLLYDRFSLPLVLELLADQIYRAAMASVYAGRA